MVGRRRLGWDEYAIAWARTRGGFDPRLASPSVRRWLYGAYRVGSLLGRLWVRPIAVTVVSVLLSLLVPIVAVRQPLGPIAAAGLVLLVAAAESVRVALAVSTGQSTRLGYVYDAFAERLGEAFWLTAFWLTGAPGVVVVVGGALTWLHEYVRTRAASAGMKESRVVTIAERSSRVSTAVIGLFVAGLAGLLKAELRAGTIAVVAAVWVLLALFGLGQLLAAVRRALR
ncbi:MAG TPA: CDP-alcohol phosphatidyltransferase family protein [Micromonosporaceae bacterium]|nr:CDP-alcohol phosphatidyltransferase family protein [Micromonosporaceae bacterium]